MRKKKKTVLTQIQVKPAHFYEENKLPKKFISILATF